MYLNLCLTLDDLQTHFGRQYFVRFEILGMKYIFKTLLHMEENLTDSLNNEVI